MRYHKSSSEDRYGSRRGPDSQSDGRAESPSESPQHPHGAASSTEGGPSVNVQTIDDLQKDSRQTASLMISRKIVTSTVCLREPFVSGHPGFSGARQCDSAH